MSLTHKKSRGKQSWAGVMGHSIISYSSSHLSSHILTHNFHFQNYLTVQVAIRAPAITSAFQTIGQKEQGRKPHCFFLKRLPVSPTQHFHLHLTGENLVICLHALETEINSYIAGYNKPR